ncbi:DUF4290 domain-containing protein [Hymenobacter rubripertinctus]|uniref:DUF4290 domain-containing protein n=1 Tax=Hymenobacter rubripertinctus TaxID=2029981 RepID=A0A418R7F6_9BACT|nr:DUF4290 domain-containing protein [Hymenobacter rubripertinctus]RIY13319.1 DUF4290 domain-containing protein [Hymenobacter rubripertinctus]
MTLPSLHKHELLQREYGQSTFILVQQLAGIEDRAERTRRAQQIVQLIFRLQPALRDQPDSQAKVWNHVFEMADGELDVDAPFPLVAQVNLAPPQRIPYPAKGPKFRAYGQAVEQLVAQALTLEDPAEREQATVIIGRTMKFLYRSHNKENAKDVTILKHLKELSGGALTLDPDQVDAQNLFEFAATNTGGGRPAPFIVAQPRQERESSGGNRRGSNGGGGNNGGNRRDKQRRGGGRKNRQEPQQPPQ